MKHQLKDCYQMKIKKYLKANIMNLSCGVKVGMWSDFALHGKHKFCSTDNVCGVCNKYDLCLNHGAASATFVILIVGEELS